MEGVVKLMGELDGGICWQAPGLSRVSWWSGYTQGCIFPGVRVCFPRELIPAGGGSSCTE